MEGDQFGRLGDDTPTVFNGRALEAGDRPARRCLAGNGGSGAGNRPATEGPAACGGLEFRRVRPAGSGIVGAHPTMPASTLAVGAQLDALVEELRTVADPDAAEAQIESVTTQAAEPVAAASARPAEPSRADVRRRSNGGRLMRQRCMCPNGPSSCKLPLLLASRR